jgi:hypothetical protein
MKGRGNVTHRRVLAALLALFLLGVTLVRVVQARPMLATAMLVESPHGSTGRLTWGWWKQAPGDDGSPWPYEPSGGSDAGWWTPGFSPSGWDRSDAARVLWHGQWHSGSSWYPWIPEIGEYALRADGMGHNQNWMWRSDPFDFSPPPAGYEISSVQLTVWSDNATRWYLNGSLVVGQHGGPAHAYPVSIDLLQPSGNMLAVYHRNDYNPAGFQYRLTLVLQPVAPALDLGSACGGGTERTLTWAAQAGLEYQVQAARDDGFTGDVRDSGWIAADQHTFSGLAEGTWHYRIRARDGAETSGWSAPAAAEQDATPPTTTATPSGTPGKACWYVSAVHVDLAAVDTGCGGLQGTQYQVDGGGWQVYAGPFALSDGVHVVEYASVDAVGNAETAQSLTLNVDTTPPATTATPSGTIGDGGWWRSDVEVTLSATDATSGVDATVYRVDGAAPQMYGGSPFTVSGEGVHTVAYWSVDVAGNTGVSATQQIHIDTVPPSSSIESLSDGRWVAGTVDLDGMASDATSGVALVDVSTDGGSSWQRIEGTESWSSAWDTTAVSDGDYRVCTRARDVAGNVEAYPCITVHVDNTPPSALASPTGTAGNGGWWRSSVAVALSASDGTGIGVAGIQYRVDGGTWQDYGGPFTVTGDGAHTVEYRSADYLGNAEGIQSLQIRIDTRSPATRPAVTGTLGLNGWYTDTVTVTLAAADATSGVNAVCLDSQTYTTPVTYTVDGYYDLPFYATDVAGNQEEASVLSFGLDTAPPEARVAGGEFCPGCGEVLLLQPVASDATSGLAAWRMEIAASGEAVAGSQVIREWTGSAAPSPVPWDGRGTDGKRVKKGAYTLRLWVQDGAGWTAVATGEVRVNPKPSSPSPPAPLPTSTPVPIPTATLLPTSTPTNTPSPTLRPGETPQPTSIPTLTSTPMPKPTLEPVPVGVVLRVGVFRDDDANGLKGPGELGLADARIRVESGTWSEIFIADASGSYGAEGVVTITLPGAGSYEIALAGYPAGAAWEPTTRTAMQVRIGDDGSVVFLPAGEDTLPTGMAEGVAFAFGLVAVAAPAATPTLTIPLWPSYLLLGGVLIWLAQGTGRARIAAAIQERVGIEKRLNESQADLGHTFIEED